MTRRKRPPGNRLFPLEKDFPAAQEENAVTSRGEARVNDLPLLPPPRKPFPTPVTQNRLQPP